MLSRGRCFSIKKKRRRGNLMSSVFVMLSASFGSGMDGEDKIYAQRGTAKLGTGGIVPGLRIA